MMKTHQPTVTEGLKFRSKCQCHMFYVDFAFDRYSIILSLLYIHFNVEKA